MLALRFTRPARALVPALWALLLLLLGSCGGVDSGGTGAAVAVGPIQGFGSIIVNGVRFNDSAATILDDDGAIRTRDQLKLGMMTRVDGTTLASKTATATTIRIGSEIIGPVTAVDRAGGTLTVLGQSVLVTPATAFDPSFAGGFGGVQTGAVVEVYARYDAVKGRYTATRIEPRADASFYKLRGTLGAVDAMAQTLVVGAQTISYADLPSSDVQALPVGNLVRVRLKPTADASGVWSAIEVLPGVIQLPDSDDAQIEGRISAWVSSRQFSVNGIPVDASTADFPQGEDGVQPGARVEVEGSSSGGVLKAVTVVVEDDEIASNAVFDLYGTIDSLDPASQTFTLQGVAVDYSGSAVQYSMGAASDLAVGRVVHVTGTLSMDGQRIDAQTITFEDR